MAGRVACSFNGSPVRSTGTSFMNSVMVSISEFFKSLNRSPVVCGWAPAWIKFRSQSLTGGHHWIAATTWAPPKAATILECSVMSRGTSLEQSRGSYYHLAGFDPVQIINDPFTAHREFCNNKGWGIRGRDRYLRPGMRIMKRKILTALGNLQRSALVLVINIRLLESSFSPQ